MELTTATARQLGDLKRPIASPYQVGLIIYELYKTKKYQGEKIKYIKKDSPTRLDFNRVVGKLLRSGVLSRSKEMPDGDFYSVIGQGAATDEELICAIDPFCYVSHLSAMSYHGLTDRFPKVIFVTGPDSRTWGAMADERMKKDLKEDLTEYKLQSLPLLKRIKLSKINRKIINPLTTKNFDAGAYVVEHKKALRTSTIGRTFLDMIRNPDLCGGIYHVLDVYKHYAERYLRLIVDEAEQHGTQIDKVRLGYILDERLGLKDKTIGKWQEFAQRGGSRKLVADNSYLPTFSEKWALSINIEEVEK